MAAIHYKSALCVTLTVCGQPLNKLSISHSDKPNMVTCAKCQKHQDVIRAHSALVSEAERKRNLEREPMPWCEPCGSYHHKSAPHIVKTTKVRISFEIEPNDAYELAQFCKRTTWSTFAECSTGKDNTYQMRDAHGLLYAALREAGFDPR